MGRRASPWPAILTRPDQILGVRWLSLFRAAPHPVQQALLAVGSHVKGANYSLHAEPNVPGGLPAGLFGCMILTQMLQFLAPEQALRFPLVACAHADKPA